MLNNKCNLLVYDNNGSNMTLLFDNDTTRLTKSVITSFDSISKNIVSKVIRIYNIFNNCSKTDSDQFSTTLSKTKSI